MLIFYCSFLGQQCFYYHDDYVDKVVYYGDYNEQSAPLQNSVHLAFYSFRRSWPDCLEFHNTLIEVLELDTPPYTCVKYNIRKMQRAFTKIFVHVFHLSNSLLSTIKCFYHNIDTGQASLDYLLPYCKSPAGLASIKDELERMIKLKIIQYSHSTWGCLYMLVLKSPENGKPQFPCFVVDYRALMQSP